MTWDVFCLPPMWEVVFVLPPMQEAFLGFTSTNTFKYLRGDAWPRASCDCQRWLEEFGKSVWKPFGWLWVFQKGSFLFESSCKRTAPTKWDSTTTVACWSLTSSSCCGSQGRTAPSCACYFKPINPFKGCMEEKVMSNICFKTSMRE